MRTNTNVHDSWLAYHAEVSSDGDGVRIFIALGTAEPLVAQALGWHGAARAAHTLGSVPHTCTLSFPPLSANKLAAPRPRANANGCSVQQHISAARDTAPAEQLYSPLVEINPGGPPFARFAAAPRFSRAGAKRSRSLLSTPRLRSRPRASSRAQTPSSSSSLEAIS